MWPWPWSTAETGISCRTLKGWPPMPIRWSRNMRAGPWSNCAANRSSVCENLSCRRRSWSRPGTRSWSVKQQSLYIALVAFPQLEEQSDCRRPRAVQFFKGALTRYPGQFFRIAIRGFVVQFIDALMLGLFDLFEQHPDVRAYMLRRWRGSFFNQ